MKKLFVNKKSGEVVAYTIITGFDSDYLNEDEILDNRLQAAIDDEIINDDMYIWMDSKKDVKGLILI